MADPNQEDELAGTEQPFVAHLVELRDRLIKAMVAVGVVAVVLFAYPGPGALYDILAAPLVANLPTGATLIATSVSGANISWPIEPPALPWVARHWPCRPRGIAVHRPSGPSASTA